MAEILYYTCTYCERSQHKDEFVKNHHGPRHCKQCRDTRESRRQHEEKARQAAEMLGVLLVPDNKPMPTMPKIQELVGSLVDCFGGMQALSATVHEQFARALHDRPGSHGNLQMLMSFLRLVNEANRTNTDEEVAKMSMEQIVAEQKRMVVTLLMEAATDKNKREAMESILGTIGVTELDVIGVQHIL